MADYDPLNGTDLGDGRIKTPVFRLSFPSLFKAKRFSDGNDPKFSLAMLFPKTANLLILRKLAKDALIAKWPDKKQWPGELARVDLRTYLSSLGKPWPLRDGDLQSYDGYAGMVSIQAGVKEEFGAPMCMTRDGRQATESDLYAGCYCLAIVNAFAYAHPTSKGVSFGLQGVQKWQDGEHFGSRRVSAEDFDAYDDAEDAGAYDSAIGDDF